MNISISSKVLSRPLEAILDATPPTITAGYSVWEEVVRPKRKSVVNWQGTIPFQQSIMAMFDGWTTSTSVEGSCEQLEKLALSAGSLDLPPVVKVSGPIPHKDLEWYIMSIEWGDVIYANPGDGQHRLRQRFTITLIERVDMITTLNNEKKLPVRPTRYRTVVVKKGYDLQQIASLTMGNSALWRRITNTKGKKFRDPYVKPGTKVKVPIL